ncbi:hypothetical protein KQI84_18615 [bacterium]|nr:hypothetical protein [bacterium]
MTKRSHITFLFSAIALLSSALWIAHPLAHIDDPAGMADCPVCALSHAVDVVPVTPTESLTENPPLVRLAIAEQQHAVPTAPCVQTRRPRGPPAISVSL